MDIDINEIKEIIAALKDTGIVEFEFENGGARVKIRKEGAILAHEVSRPPGQPGSVMPGRLEEGAYSGSGKEKEVSKEISGGVPRGVIKSPIVGTFYRSAAPEAEPYVEVGSLVKKGQIVCIIEAMKLMNEIEADMDGKIIEILTENAHPVEYGEPLFALEPL